MARTSHNGDFWLRNNNEKLNDLKHLVRVAPQLSDSQLAQQLGSNKQAIRRARQRYNIWRVSNNRAERENTNGILVDKQQNHLIADIIIKSKKGKKPTIKDALNNPKFREILKTGCIDLNKYEISRFVTNSWDVTNRKGERFTNYQFKIWWTLKIPNILLSVFEEIEKNIAKKSQSCNKKIYNKNAKRMIEISLYDLHYGMLSWSRETGEDYDLKIARNVYENAISQIIDRVKNIEVDYFLFPIGNDFLHVNNITNKTPTAEHSLDVDSRLVKIISESEYMLRDSINQLKKIAPVKLFWVPGNHDPQTSYYLLRMLGNFFHNDINVEVDTSPKPRKYKVYGKCLIGFMHGCTESNRKNWALMMADEEPDLWKSDQYREIHTGHQHRKNELVYHSASTHGGVTIRIIPSICATDFWHYTKGFTKTSKTAQFFVWNKDYGLESIQDIHIRMDLYKKKK